MTRRYHKQRKSPALETWQILALLIGAIGFLLPFSFLSVTLEGLEQLLLVMVGAGFLVLLLLAGLIYYKEAHKRALSRALKLSDIDHMSGEEFEDYVSELLKFQGYKTSLTPRSNDYGVDIVARRDGLAHAIQIKRYHARKKVGRSAISDAVAGKAYYGAQACMVVTNSFFSSSAKHLAHSNECELVDRKLLSEWILEYQHAI